MSNYEKWSLLAAWICAVCGLLALIRMFVN